jgi:hypothetical protein
MVMKCVTALLEVGKEMGHVLRPAALFSGNGPSSDAIKFDRIHGELPWLHNEAKVVNFGSVKGAFLQFQM